jgi:hypothetical protein
LSFCLEDENFIITEKDLNFLEYNPQKIREKILPKLKSSNLKGKSLFDFLFELEKEYNNCFSASGKTSGWAITVSLIQFFHRTENRDIRELLEKLQTRSDNSCAVNEQISNTREEDCASIQIREESILKSLKIKFENSVHQTNLIEKLKILEKEILTIYSKKSFFDLEISVDTFLEFILKYQEAFPSLVVRNSENGNSESFKPEIELIKDNIVDNSDEGMIFLQTIEHC